MKEKKLGGKKHGMVLIISVGKKGGKDPTKVSDTDKKKLEKTAEKFDVPGKVRVDKGY